MKVVLSLLIVFFAAAMVFPLPTPTSPPLAHRTTRSIRQTRHSAMQPSYSNSPGRRPVNAAGRAPFQNIANLQEGVVCWSNKGPFVEMRSGRGTPLLQETPSRRRRRVPQASNDENRSTSPTPRSSRSFRSANGLPTPPDTQRSAAQRKECEQASGTNSATISEPLPTPPLTHTTPQNQASQSTATAAAGPSRRSLAQLARQQRERELREQAALQQQQTAARAPPMNPPPQADEQQPPGARDPPAGEQQQRLFIRIPPLHTLQAQRADGANRGRAGRGAGRGASRGAGRAGRGRGNIVRVRVPDSRSFPLPVVLTPNQRIDMISVQ
ncbi:hypothetical protein R3P38DRAFT_3235414 [Favolaschia claudopus]|uniref:Uncharacterized protein n=1 Tax=Favolaschia claudopus TaxID=2862362 RepID=A0AAV9ZDQ8_9AGAR